MGKKCKKILALFSILILFLSFLQDDVFAAGENVTIVEENVEEYSEGFEADESMDKEETPPFELENSQSEIEEGTTYSEMNQVTPAGGLRYTVLVLDASGSMRGKPISIEKAAAEKFCSSMIAAEGNNYIAIISYGTNVHLSCDYTNDLEILSNSLNGIYDDGGTDSNAALQKAQELIENVPQSATKNIVFLSDGLPQSGDSSTSGPYTINDSVDYYKYANALYKTAQSIQKKCNLYSLGFFHSLKGSELAFAQRLMEDIQNAGYYNVENVEDLEFVFGEITDSIIETLNKNHYVKQHKKYYQSEEYALEIINNYPENLMQIYEETLQDNSVLSYDTLDTLNKYLSFDFGNLDGSGEFKILLSEIISGQINIEKFYLDNMESLLGDVIGYLKDYISKDVDNSILNLGIDKEILLKRMNEYVEVMQKEKWGTESFENAYKGLKRTVDESVDAGAAKKALKKYNSGLNIGVDITSIVLSTASSYIDYYVAANSYINLAEEMKDVLNTLRDNITNQEIKDKIIKENDTCWIDSWEFLDSLEGTITEYLDIMTAFEQKNANEIAYYVLKEGGCSAMVVAGDKFSDKLWSVIPLVKGFKKGTGIFQFLIDASVPNARLRAYSANLLARLRYIHMFMKYTVDFYGNELINNGSDSDTAFQIALRFDAAVNLYKSIQILACDYAEQYENTCFEDNTNKINDIEAKPLAYGPFWYLIKDKAVKERSWNSAAGCLAQVQRIRTQAIKCHEGELSDNSSEGLVHYKEDKLKIVTIACPVSVLVKDPKGKQVAYVSDDKISVSSGYEPYFNTYVNEGQSGSCTKIVIIPSDEDYEIQINGTNSGTMDVYIGEYEEREISGIEYITDVSVNRDSEIKLEQQNGHTVLRTDTDDIYPLNNDVEIWEGNIAAQFIQGDGTKENPYQISDGSELSLLSEMVSKGNDFENVYFLLVSDIDLGEVAFTNQNCRKGLWRPIGTNSRSAFKGNFDGNFHQITIKAAYQEAVTINAGIFGYVSGTIQNLRTSGNIAIQSKQSVSGTSLIIQCGGICAYAEEAYIKNCENNIKCTVSCGSSFNGAYGVVGGIVGTADQQSEIVECINRQDISSNTAPGSRTDAMSGGIAAECINLSKITGCENYGTITAETTKDNEKYFSIAYPGGICGFAGVTGAISNCINYGKIRGKSNIAVPCDYQTVVSTGGIIGRNVDDKPEACIKNCANYSDDLIAEGSGFVDICQKGLIVGNFEKDGLKQNITVIDKMKLRYSDKRFDLDAVSDSGYLTYQSNNEKVISVSAKGRVYINGIGSAEITVSAPATEKYKAAAAVISVSVEAGKIDFSKCSAALSNKTFLYNGKEQRPDVIVKNGEEELVNGIDFTISYKNNINVGTAEIVLTGIGEYQGSIRIPFTIIAQGLDKEEIEISNAKIASIPAQIYTGKAVCPTVSITLGKKTLRENTDYILYYKNNIDPGTASIIVNGMGSYKGTIKLTFQIQAFLEKAEGLEQSQNGTKYITIKWSRTAGANGYIVYRSIAGKNHFTKIAVIKKSTTVTYKDKKVKTGTVYHYKIRAYRSINKKEYYSSYSDVLTANTKLAKTVFISVKSAKKRQATLNWKKVPGAGGYEVYRSSMKNGKYVRIATIRSPKGQKYVDKKGKSKKVYYYKVRAYKAVKGGKIYGKFSGLKRVKTK